MACHKTYKLNLSGQETSYCQPLPEGKVSKDNKRSQSLYGNPNMTSVCTKYRAGEEVVLYYFPIATDTDYNFILDGRAIRPDYDSRLGFKISFIMPDHDVKLECVRRNTMIYEMSEKDYIEK